MVPLAALLAFEPEGAQAQWTADPAVNLPVCTATGYQSNLQMVSDGAGGAWMVWQDGRGGAGASDLYYQHLNAAGVPQLAADGVALVAQPNTQGNQRMISDGSGGAYIVWEDERVEINDKRVFIQRVNASGVPLWDTDGTTVCLDTAWGSQADLALDGQGGVIVTWCDGRVANDANIYAQRFNASGVPQWTAGGIVVCDEPTWIQTYPRVVSDGAGGAIIAWADRRAGSNGDDIYARYVNAAGVGQGSSYGTLLCNAVGDQREIEAVSDGAGGAIFIWMDYRSGSFQWDLYGQRVNTSITPLWSAGGLAICNHPAEQSPMSVTSDGAGGAIVVYRDYRFNNTNLTSICASRVTAAGALLWGGSSGIVVANYQAEQEDARAVWDPSGYVYIAWADRREFMTYNLRLQKYDMNGSAQWETGGIVVSNAAGDQRNPVLLPGGGPAGSVIVGWRDTRSGSAATSDIYAARVHADGGLPVALSGWNLE